MLRAALVDKTKFITIGVNKYRNSDYFLSKQFFNNPNDNHNYDKYNYNLQCYQTKCQQYVKYQKVRFEYPTHKTYQKGYCCYADYIW